MIRVGIVAGEASGDLLGAGLIAALKARCPDVRVEGIAGPLMQAEGCHVLFPAERLAVMGLVEVLRHLRELHAIRHEVAQHFLANPPDVFVGIDAPDFTLGLERTLRQAGIPTVHYVSPSVWAWRQYRVRKIARSTDHMLTLLPFEAAFYKSHNVPVTFVGHPLADMIPLDVDRAAARAALGVPAGRPMVALLPGSRMNEVRALGELFLRAALLLWRRRPELCFYAPMATPAVSAVFQEMVRAVGAELPVTLITGRAREVLAGADAGLVASGTATLEAALLKCPMVVAYRLAPLTYRIAKHLVKTPYCALPNLLAGRALAPEFIQDAATPEALSAALEPYLDAGDNRDDLVRAFRDIHLALRQDASARAADAVLQCAGLPHAADV